MNISNYYPSFDQSNYVYLRVNLKYNSKDKEETYVSMCLKNKPQ